VNEFRARFYDGVQAIARDGLLIFDSDAKTAELRVEGIEPRVVAWADLRIEPPLGRTARRVWLDAVSHAEVADSAEYRQLEKSVAPPGWPRLVSAAESHKGAILGSLVMLVLVVLFMVKVGIPAMANSLAFKLPQSTLNSVGDQTLKTLDKSLLEPSKVSKKRQRQIREKFAQVAQRVPGLPAYRIEFRSGFHSPNAFALPSGTILVTDEMVKFVKSDDELFAVLGHELGHVRLRHGMRLVLQQTGVLLAVSFFLGDISGSLSSFGAIPIALVENGYSREFEQEADDYAVIFCLRSGMGTRPLTALFARLRKEHPSELPAWFSSHPNLSERIKRIEKLGALPAASP
jgi:Zn-dependent protease with chaperone function